MIWIHVLRVGRLGATRGLRSWWFGLCAVLLGIGMAGSARAAVSFVDSGQELGSGGDVDVAVGDLDGDLDPDVMVLGGAGATVWINQGQAQGGALGVFAANGGPAVAMGRSLELRNLDTDSDPDAVVLTGGTSETVQVWVNQGGVQGGAGGVFLRTVQLIGSPLISEGALGELDGTGGPDLYVARGTGAADQVWTSNGFGTFTDSGQGLGNSDSADVAVGDVDGDGDLDAVVATDGGNRVWLNQGGAQAGTAGMFADSGQVLGNEQTLSVALGDVDGDTDMDVYFGNIAGDAVWINQGGAQGGTAGVFVDSGQSLGTTESRGVALGDLDRDGDLDAVTANSGANFVWINQGGDQGGSAGTFADSGLRLGSVASEAVALSDLDGDGDMDAVVANSGGASKVYLQEAGVEPPATQRWQVSSVDTAGDTGRLNAIALNGEGYPYISYVRIVPRRDGRNAQLRVARWDGVRWHREFVDRAEIMGGRSGYTSIAIDSQGRPHVAYAAGGGVGNDLDLRYAFFDGTDWVVETVYDQINILSQVSLALDSNDRAHVSAGIDEISEIADLLYAFRSDSGWEVSELKDVTGQAGEYNSLVLDANDRPHISYFYPSQHQVKYAHNPGTGWEFEVVEDAAPTIQEPYCSIVLDEGGEPAILYNWEGGKELRLARRGEAGWTTRTLVTTPERVSTETRVELAFDGEGVAHFSYGLSHETANTLKLVLGEWDGVTVTTEMLDASGYVGRSQSLALDGEGNAHVSYYAEPHGDLRYVKWGPDYEVRTVISEGTVMAPSIDLGEGDPHLGYYFAESDEISVASWQGDWVLNAAASSTAAVEDLAVGASREADHLCFYDADATQLKYAEWDGSSWVVRVIDPVLNTGFYNDMVLLEGSETPQMAYWDGTNRRVKLAIIDQTGLLTRIPNTAGPALDANSGYVSIATLARGNAGISYYDGVNGDLRLAIWDRVTLEWTDVRVDGDGADVGRMNDIEADGTSGGAVLAYYDETNDSIQFAYELEGGGFEVTEAVAESGVVTSMAVGLGLNTRLRARIAYTVDTGEMRVAVLRDGVWGVEDPGDLVGVVNRADMALEDRTHLGYTSASGGLWYAFRSATLDVSQALPANPVSGEYNPLDACRATISLFSESSIDRPEPGRGRRGPGLQGPVLQGLVGEIAPMDDSAVFGAWRQMFEQSEGGRYYIDFYARYGSEMGALGLADRELLWDAFGVLQNFMPGLEAMVQGRGDEIMVTQEMVDDALDIWQRLAAAGSVELAERIGLELVRITTCRILWG